MRTSITSVPFWGSLFICVLSLQALPAQAAPAEAPTKIRDNLFLLEEAYNQEPGVIQHIQAFQLNPRTQEWGYSFTEEWPLPTDLNQVSVTIPVTGFEDSTGVGDLLLNYRFQAIGLGGKGWLAFAPRLSLALPTGDFRTGHGQGGAGLQTNLPVSMDLGPQFTAHLNAGLTWTPAARSPEGVERTALDVCAGAALVYLPRPWFNALVEVLYTSLDDVQADRNVRATTLTVNPGVRFALDFPSGLQIVPGFSVPMQMSSSSFTVSTFAYLSFEHPMW